MGLSTGRIPLFLYIGMAGGRIQQPICKVDILLIQTLTIVSTPYIDVTFRFLARDFLSIRGLYASGGARLLVPISITIYSLSIPPIRN